MYLNGRGVERDVKKAKKLYEKAAEIGNEEAKAKLEKM